ncbi:MAG: putative phage class 3 lipase [Rhodospirillales bacterium]|nr:putative phage class 3 lipase [Rhodospirillales bacterium]
MISDLDLARICAATYSEPCHSIRHDRGVVHYQVHQFGGRTVLAIQGTQDKAQAIADANAWPKRSKAGWWAHSGFVTAAEALEQMVLKHLGQPLTITGHSLGAAVSVAVSGLLLRWWRPSAIEVVGFGCPRVGMPALVRALADVEIRLYRNGNDVVPLLPWPFPLPYRHVRPLIPIGAPMLNPVEAHGIARYISAMTTDSQERAAAE